MAAIGIGHDVSLLYRNAATIARIDDLSPALGQKLTALLGTDVRGGSGRSRAVPEADSTGLR